MKKGAGWWGRRPVTTVVVEMALSKSKAGRNPLNKEKPVKYQKAPSTES
jgi:hypothetical protein